ncbi:MAG: nuclear transport factor 2 family protein [Gammaproteobacteria bacterium]
MKDIETLLEAYGDGLYRGDVDLLAQVFHPQAMLYGEVRGEPVCRPLGPYLERVAARRSPAQLGEAYGFEVLSIEVTGEIALARMRCRMLGFDYLDYLSLVRRDGAWAIASKTYTDCSSRAG